ncbi:Cleavage factor two Cft2/polyadenylation factor CPSF-73 [Taphrina deformans PYCC 5710]|uniref:Cleavage and polyadenylation specificity factor subunit 2 n=1 Tax=Taphrina deformans (strain PYCC 5710 / ATCC 11124 / CBS 356.35 / IMI 108563 / JCM 9778 / NBRC 8474) TaxID=1097556 RepID=R4XCM8_TAPDE|nr:Cleavage factor two Cft2/polyadenylation factor CPSF-73 [Taphrina deformans PYCC 5710]|eukprot:CCG81055.1 Cleavage factor two Cft2/polyadenylation factor CPSF-73 [Taphrina deformans PYCC 5710]
MIEFTTLNELSGAGSLLSFDSTLVLIDPACDKLLRFDAESIPRKPDLIILSHADLTHLGGYVYGFKHLDWHNVPVYASLPVVNMGRTTMYDALKSTLTEYIAMADIDDAFDWVTSLRYSQATQLSGKCQGITITAYNAGHTLGGALWKITRGSDHIVYAVDWNQARDQHLNGTALFSGGQVQETLARPSLLITDSKNATSMVPPRSKRNAAIFDSISSTLQGGGSVLIPIDASSRALELCEMLENYWANVEAVRATPVYFLSHSGSKTIGYARSMLEWMSEKMINDYGSSGGLFDFKHLKVLSSASQITNLPAGPKVILATSSDLDSGYSQAFLHSEVANNPANLLILSQRSSYRADSLAGQLMQRWTEETESVKDELPEYITLDLERSIEMRKQVPLTGPELKEHNRREQTRRDEELAKAAIEERNRNILDADDSESEDEEEQAVLAASGTLAGRGPTSVLSLGSSALLGTSFDLYLESPQIAKLPARLRTFPFVEKRRRFDDYGEILRPDEFKRADEEEKDIETAFVETTKKSSGNTGQKRKWGEIANGKVAEENAEEVVDDFRAVPSKLEISEETIRLKCRLRYIDMEGLHDGTSLKNIVESVNPRKLVIIHGTAADKEEMKSACEKMKAFTKAIIVPELRVSVEVSLDTNAFDVRLSDAFSASLHWQKLYEQTVAHVTGKLIPQSEAESKEPPVLDVLASKEDFDNAPRIQALFVGDIRLADLRRLLIEKGHSAELRGGGVLFCDGCVSVTKASAGEVLLEGLGTDHFYGVRESVYQSLAIIETN